MPLTKLKRGENWGETTEFYFWFTKYETSVNLCGRTSKELEMWISSST